MDIDFRNRELEKICTDFSHAEKKFGSDMAWKIHQRIGEIQSASSVQVLISGHVGRCHALTGDRSGQYAMDLKQPNRLLFVVIEEVGQLARIVYIGNPYH